MSSSDGSNDPTQLEARVTQPETTGAVAANAPGYKLGEVIGRGGMGEVVLAHDLEMERDVALKRLRGDASEEAIRRFLREAKIQARLDHPAIVPVHELGRDAEGMPYFTMKRLSGTTLAALLASGEATLQRLLRTLVDVCLAIELAHTRRIVHRDLKPSNIMVGDFGEVYVIDWGVARILDEAVDLTVAQPREMHSTDDTRTGQILGTPGYMAPEQLRGLAIGPAADVYALGAILFEILAGEMLHPRGAAALASTLGGRVVTSPAARARARSVPPELDEACRAALAEDPAARPSARQLADRIQHYLDGDRDVEQRRKLSAQLIADGQAALANGDRAQAVRLGGRALVFDPSSEPAAKLVMSLVTDPPDEVPPEVAANIDAEEVRLTRQRSGRALVPLSMFFLILPLLGSSDVESWMALLGTTVGVGMMAAMAFVNWRIVAVPLAVSLVVNLIAVTLFTRISGPFVLTPALICAVMLSLAAVPWLNDRVWAIVAYTILAVVSPFALERLGVLDASWEMTTRGVLSTGTALSRGAHKVIPLFLGNIAIIAVVAFYARGVSRDRMRAQRQLQVQAWHLRQLLPRDRA